MRLQIFVLNLLLAAMCLAEGPAVSISATPLGDLTGIRALDEIVPLLDRSKLMPLADRSWEAEIVGAGQRAVNKVVNLKPGALNGYYTLSTASGDTLVANWGIATQDSVEKSLWLWDTPYKTGYILEVDPGILLADRMKQYCEGLLVWRGASLANLKSLQLYYPQDREYIRATAAHEESSIGTLQFRFVAAPKNNIGYVAVLMSKPFFRTDYPRQAFQVPERFPPLRSRLEHFGRTALFDELGKGYTAPALTYPGTRDSIVLEELVVRGPLSESELEKIVFADFDWGQYYTATVIQSRLAALLDALKSRDGLQAYSGALGNLLARTPPGDGPSRVVITFFNFMERNQVDLEQLALRFLQHNVAPERSLAYLEKHAGTNEMLEQLTRLRLTSALEERKQRAIRSIQKRLDSARVPWHSSR